MDPFGTCQTGAPATRRTLAVDHRGYRLHATASRRVTGAVLVNAELSGGPLAIHRCFCVTSDRPDLASACEQCIGELREVVDALCQCAERSLDA